MRARARDELVGEQQQAVLQLLAGYTPDDKPRPPTIEDVDEAQRTFDRRDELIYRRHRRAAGALLSGTFATYRSRLPRTRLTQAHFVHLHENSIISLVRPLVGAVAAIVLVVIVESGSIASITVDETQAYAWAVAVGFSERLLDRAVNSIADAVPTDES